MKKSIGILYICTGPYYLFWKDFFITFEEKFLQNTEKRYFVFTDSEEIFASDMECVNVIKIENQPWPLITLLRFNTFLKIEKDLKKCDYLIFLNANIICNKQINEKEILPFGKYNLFVTSHPGYWGMPKIKFPYDRNKKSLAYIPWNCGENYVIGAMFGGKSEAFIRMSHKLRDNISEDLKKNIIAKWHDESHLNRYIIGRSDVKVLSPEYCYPYGINAKYDKKILAVSKQNKFDVNTFKGNYKQKNNIVKRILGKIKRKICIKEHYFLLRDTILNKTIKKI